MMQCIARRAGYNATMSARNESMIIQQKYELQMFADKIRRKAFDFERNARAFLSGAICYVK
jgi:hypothetical protein